MQSYLLLEQLERALLRLVAGLHQVLEGLLAQGVLLPADNATLVLHQILLRQAAGSLLCRSVPNACLGADSASSSSCHSIVRIYFLLLDFLAFLVFLDLRRRPAPPCVTVGVGGCPFILEFLKLFLALEPPRLPAGLGGGPGGVTFGSMGVAGRFVPKLF
jgi:hypothetical protein